MDCMIRKKVVLGFLGAIFLMVCLVNPAIAQVSTDAVLILHFDEGFGTIAKDESGCGNDGTIYGATWVDGISGKALSFDGVDDYVDCWSDSSLNIADEITIEAWVKPRSLSNKYMCIAGKDRSGGPKYDSYSLKIMKNNNLAFELIIDGTDKRLETSLSDEKWSHFVGTYDGLNMILYKNGLEVNHVSVSGLITTQPNTNFVIGTYSNHDLFFNGIIDDVAIYSRALTPEEIEAHYLAKRAGGSTEESASALINSVSNSIDSLKLNGVSTSLIEESLKNAQSAYDIGNYDEAYEFAMSAQKMADDAYETQQHVESAQSEIDEAKYINPEVNEAENKSNEDKSSGMSIFIVIFAIVGLLAVTYLIFNKLFGKKKVEGGCGDKNKIWTDDLTDKMLDKICKKIKKKRMRNSSELEVGYIKGGVRQSPLILNDDSQIRRLFTAGAGSISFMKEHESCGLEEADEIYIGYVDGETFTIRLFDYESEESTPKGEPRCAKCGRTDSEIHEDILAAKQKGMFVYGESEAGLLYCDNCEKYFCGLCREDLTMYSGCPECGKVLD